MKNRFNILVLFGAMFVSALFFSHYAEKANATAFKAVIPAPQFTQRNASAWINSPPLTIQELQGKVLLIDVWTYSCYNCYRSLPWLNSLEKKYEDLQIIGIHTPEFEHEKVYDNIVAKAKEFELHHPIMLDNDFAYWNLLNNQYWPAYYLVDKQGNIRYRFIGETHKNTPQAKRVEEAIEQLLTQ